jgi:hypothetical protein
MKITLRTLCTLLLLCSAYGHAYSDKTCYPSSGSPYVSTFTATGVVAADKNGSGKSIFNDTQNINQSVTYKCYCSNPAGYSFLYWTGTSDYPATGQYGNRLQITPEMQINVESFIYTNTSGGNYFDIPFSPADGARSQSTNSCGTADRSAKGATQVRGNIVVTKPVIGNISFHGVVGKVYLRRDANPPLPTDPPMVVLNMDIELTVPDACTVRPGGVINVDLGQNIRQSQFRGQAYPLPPKSYTPRSFNLMFDCNFSNAAVDVILTGNRDTQTQGFASSSPDVSVIVTDSSGNIVAPNTLAGDVVVGSDSTSTTLHLKAYPTNSGANPVPEASNYTATATILLSYK